MRRSPSQTGSSGGEPRGEGPALDCVDPVPEEGVDVGNGSFAGVVNACDRQSNPVRHQQKVRRQPIKNYLTPQPSFPLETESPIERDGSLVRAEHSKKQLSNPPGQCRRGDLNPRPQDLSRGARPQRAMSPVLYQAEPLRQEIHGSTGPSCPPTRLYAAGAGASADMASAPPSEGVPTSGASEDGSSSAICPSTSDRRISIFLRG